MKTLTLESWLQLDPAVALAGRLDAEGHPQPATAADWLPLILDYTLSENVPGDVRDLFETAKAAFLYGLLFTPLFALAIEELYRVCEAAVFHRSGLAGAPFPHSKFQSNLTFLMRKGIIGKADRPKWQSIREARDFGSHMRQQMTLNPALAIRTLSRVTECVNQLYSGA